MKKSLRRAISILTAAIMSISMMSAVPAFAEEVSTTLEATETVKIGDFDCWVIDGMYFTELDGEICQVINLDELDWTSVEAPMSRAAEIDISDGHHYEGEIDISEGDDRTPTFIGYNDNTTAKKISYCIHAGFVFSNMYKVNIYGYNVAEKKWQKGDDSGPQTLNFGLFTQTIILFNGMTGAAFSKVYIDFLKDGSTGEPQIGYSFYIVERS